MALFLIQQSCTRTLNDILCHSVYISVADPDLQIRGGGGEGGHSDPEIRGEGGPKFFFTAFRGSVCSKNKGGGGGRAPALDAPLHLTLLIERTFVRH